MGLLTTDRNWEIATMPCNHLVGYDEEADSLVGAVCLVKADDYSIEPKPGWPSDPKMPETTFASCPLCGIDLVSVLATVRENIYAAEARRSEREAEYRRAQIIKRRDILEAYAAKLITESDAVDQLLKLGPLR